jgi:hypothetical protein
MIHCSQTAAASAMERSLLPERAPASSCASKAGCFLQGVIPAAAEAAGLKAEILAVVLAHLCTPHSCHHGQYHP